VTTSSQIWTSSFRTLTEIGSQPEYLAGPKGRVMRQFSLKEEAESCRALASEFLDRPEQPFLLKLASALEEVALMEEQELRTKDGRGEARARSLGGPRWLMGSGR